MSNEMFQKSEVRYDYQEGKRGFKDKLALFMPRWDSLSFFCLMLLVVHVSVVVSGGVETHRRLYWDIAGLSVDGMKNGKVWQLFTYAFLHGSWFHLLTNILMIWVIGKRLTHVIGAKNVALVLFFSSLGGGALFVLLDWIAGIDRPLVGASGAAFGLFILMAMLSPESKMFPLPIRAKNLAIGTMLASLILCLLHPAIGVPGFQSAGIWLSKLQVFRVAHACHLGGGIVGWLMMKRVMGKMVTLEDLQKQRKRNDI